MLRSAFQDLGQRNAWLELSAAYDRTTPALAGPAPAPPQPRSAEEGSKNVEFPVSRFCGNVKAHAGDVCTSSIASESTECSALLRAVTAKGTTKSSLCFADFKGWGRTSIARAFTQSEIEYAAGNQGVRDWLMDCECLRGKECLGPDSGFPTITSRAMNSLLTPSAVVLRNAVVRLL